MTIIKTFTGKVFSSKKRLLIFIIIFGLAVFVVKPFGLFQNSNPKELYKSEKVIKDDLSTTITASGQVEVENQSTIGFLSAGRVAWVGFKEGDEVKFGDVIASLDSTEAKQTVFKAEANLRSAQSSLDKVLDDIRLNRYTDDSSGETQTQKNLREVAEAARDVAFRSLETAKKELQWMTIMVPFDGTIAEIKNMEVGQNIGATNPASVTIVGNGDLHFKANIDEIDYSRLSVGKEAEIILDAFPEEKLAGHITKIGVAAIKLATGGSVIPVEISLPQDSRFKSGLNGEVNFNIISKKDVVTIPRTALHKDNGNSYVNILDKDKVVKKNITIGESLGSKVEVTSGLNEGEMIILGDVKK